uniref:SEC7 domain-containing protein n=1 Tax=Ciona savignyi TaxID=51511 RepID=H2ZA16_CIOSA
MIGSFNSLKNVLNRCEGLSVLEPNIYLTPFLEVVRSEDTTGPITGLALSSINKFLCYGLIDPDAPNAAVAVSGMADAVTHARFVGTDPANDEVVLMKILQVLRVLLLTKVGTLLTNEAVCEIMQSCFRICFEMRLSELLRKSAEHTLVDMVQLLFTRLPEFKEDSKNLLSNSMKKLPDSLVEDVDGQSQVSESSSVDNALNPVSGVGTFFCTGVGFPSSPRPIGFTGPLLPYGLACIRELFRFLISLTNPHDRHNTDVMIHMGMSLMMVGVGWGYWGKVSSTLAVDWDIGVKLVVHITNPLCQLSKGVKNNYKSYVLFSVPKVINKFLLIMVSVKKFTLLYTFLPILLSNFLSHNSPNNMIILFIQNAFPVSGLYTTHLLSLDALLTVVHSIEQRCSQNETNPTPTVVPERFSGEVPTIEELQLIKQKKKILQSGTELFNQKTKKGITFLQDQNLLAVPIDVREVSLWLRANPWLDKKMIGEYISDRRHPEILDNFVRTFKFEGLRLDESLRLYLETFRLPGEAPVIQRLIEAFSAYWSECNHHPFMNLDAAFTLSYAIIMLNTDQHNRNVRKQNEPMTFHEFQRNTKGCNGGQDFDQHMLEEIYTTIRNDEIVLPDEQVGPIRDRWLWNVFLRRGASPEGTWLSTSDEYHIYDRDIFAMNWGPTVSALSYVFDKSLEENIIQRSILGFKKCALISAHFSMCNVFDNLIVSLCKFTGLTSNGEAPDMTTVIFGSNPKAQLAARTMFHLTHRHGDILREGWRNILDVILPLYRSKLLPAAMVEVEDFVDPTGRVCLLREELPMQRSDSSIFSSFYQFMTLGGPSETSNQKQTTAEDQEAMRIAQDCVKELQLETLVTESKFLRLDSLQELMKALMQASHPPHVHDAMGGNYMEDSAIFFLELLLRVVLQNRDRIMSLWQMVRDHLYSCIVMATEYSLLLERAVVGLMRMAIRLLHREEVAEEVLASLQILLMIKPSIIPMVSRQIGYGLHELLRTNAANIHARADWITIFTVMKTLKHPDKKKFKKRKERDGKRRMTGHQQERYYGHNSDDETMVENVPGGYHTMSLQLLDLMHTLHTRAASIYSSWEAEERKVTNEPVVTAEASSLWGKCWCPLLQGIARLCCDARRQVRTSALTYLQRALLVHDLQTLTGKEWESCFNKVLFPLLTKLLENISPADPDGMEETRMRGATLLSKVFLQHLNPLLSLPTFTALWLTILDFMDKYMHIGKRDLLFEAIPESLKNMLLVM